MKRVTAAALVAVLFAGLMGRGWAQSARESDFISAIGSMQRSVVPVLCVQTIQPRLEPMPQQGISPPSQPGHAAPASPQLQPVVAGTAFFLTRRGDFITAASVLSNFLEGAPFAGCTMMVWFTSPVDPAGNFTSQAFRVALQDCVVDAQIDVARCRTIDDLTKESGGRFTPDPVTLDDRQPNAGSLVGTTGFILYDNTPIAALSHVGGYQPAPPAATQMVIDRPASAGAAGSPVYDSRGKVLGMIAQVRNLVLTNISVASTSLAISRFLAAHPIDNK
jgi:hypothetical protein